MDFVDLVQAEAGISQYIVELVELGAAFVAFTEIDFHQDGLAGFQCLGSALEGLYFVSLKLKLYEIVTLLALFVYVLLYVRADNFLHATLLSIHRTWFHYRCSFYFFFF